jgi:hypothetical protein
MSNLSSVARKTTLGSIKRLFIWPLVVVTSYIGSYIFNSLSGSYSKKLENHRYYDSVNHILVLHVESKWQPQYGYLYSTDADLIGQFYSPLIALDQKFWHRSLNILDPKQAAILNSLANFGKLRSEPTGAHHHPPK